MLSDWLKPVGAFEVALTKGCFGLTGNICSCYFYNIWEKLDRRKVIVNIFLELISAEVQELLHLFVSYHPKGPREVAQVYLSPLQNNQSQCAGQLYLAIPSSWCSLPRPIGNIVLQI
jgi:hypothetical protein